MDMMRAALGSNRSDRSAGSALPSGLMSASASLDVLVHGVNGSDAEIIHDAAKEVVAARTALNQDARRCTTSLRERNKEAAGFLEREMEQIAVLTEETRAVQEEHAALARDLSDTEDALKRHRLDRSVTMTSP